MMRTDLVGRDRASSGFTFRAIRITAPHFCAGIDCELRDAAPIIRYMRGWTLGAIRAYCARKGWKVEVMYVD